MCWLLTIYYKLVRNAIVAIARIVFQLYYEICNAFFIHRMKRKVRCWLVVLR